MDDSTFILTNPQIHQFNLPILFGPGLFNSGAFYRPLDAVYFALIYSLSGNHAFLYHLVQLTLHLINTSLLFIFFCIFFSDSVAIFLALLFLVHPINVESVAYIGSTQSELYFLPGIIALLLAGKKELTRNRFLLIIGLLCVGIFIKETGFLFLVLVILYRYLFKLGKLKKFLFSVVGLVVFYLLVRFLVGNVAFIEPTYVAIVTLPLHMRLLNIPSILIYYLKIFLFPLNFAVMQQWIIRSITIESFWVPLTLCLASAGLIINEGFSLYNHDKKVRSDFKLLSHDKQHNKHKKNLIHEPRRFPQYLFFFIWLVLGLGLIMQIVPLDMTVADRWFYFPIVGALGLIGIILQVFLLAHPASKKTLLIGAIVILSLLSLRTLIRTVDYKNNIILYAHDLKTSDDRDNPMLIDNYIIELKSAGKTDEALKYAEQSVSLDNNTLGTRITAYEYLALLYQAKDQNDVRALPAFEKAAALAKTTVPNDIKPSFVDVIYRNLADAYLFEYKSNDAFTFINTQALKQFPNDPCLYGELAIAENNLGSSLAAKKATAKAYMLSHLQNNELTIPSDSTLNNMCGFSTQ
ncbi:MAG TPA: hypothetical protein VLF93_02085 [Candidatus Saccharimonadales bacterium]|nr:hypothetical protein [Candidatus Saccharimonadales bacterium]